MIMKFLFLMIATACFVSASFGQSFYDIHDKLKDHDPTKIEHGFPTLFVGFDFQNLTQTESLKFEENNIFNTSDIASLSNPALTFGSYSFSDHFTGSVVLRSAPFQSVESTGGLPSFKYYYAQALEVGFKYYLWSLKKNQLRPYLGASVVVSDYQHNAKRSDSAVVSLYELPLSAGLSYSTNWGHFDLGGGIVSSQQFLTYPEQDTNSEFQTGRPNSRFWFSYSHYLTPGKLVDKKNLISSVQSDFSLGLGYTGAFRTNNDDSSVKKTHAFVPNATLGYYFSSLKSAIFLSYRPIEHLYKHNDRRVEYKRNVLGLEWIKYLNDFNHTVHFIGVGLNFTEYGKLENNGDTTVTDFTTDGTNLSLIFGWESHVFNHPNISLRSTFRYNPLAGVIHNDKDNVSFEQFEFTFFELVFYPRRILSK